MMVSFCVIRLELEDFSKDVDIDFNCNRSIEVRIFELSKPYFIFISNFDKGTILSAMKKKNLAGHNAIKLLITAIDSPFRVYSLT